MNLELYRTVQLWNVMDESKLNINTPRMSVRRSATSPSLTKSKMILEKQHTVPYNKSDINLDPVTEPVAVPVNCEHIPGRCKGNGVSEPIPPKKASITPSPRLPPLKSTNAVKPSLEKECKDANKFWSSNKPHSLKGSITKIEYDKERKDDKSSSNVEEEEEDEEEKDDDDDDDAYSDALDTLSTKESFVMNCSVSGVSSLDNLDAKKFGTFSKDKQTQDYMMSRFLPAAKAMTLQPPQYASRKQSVLVEQPRNVNKLIRLEKKSLVNKYTTDIVPYTGQCQEEEGSGDEADDYDESANILAKGHGLFCHSRIRNSLYSINPVPGMKMRNAFPMSSAYEVEKPSKSSHIRSFSPAPVIKKAWHAIHKNKSSSGAASPDTQEVRKKWTSESNRFIYSGELLERGRLSPFCRSSVAAAAGKYPCQSSPQFPFRGAKLLGDSKEAGNNQFGKLKFQRRQGNIQEVLFQGARKSSNSGSLTFEKTYIGTASTVKLSCSNSNPVDNTHRIDTVVTYMDKRMGRESNCIVESFQDIKHQQDLEEKNTLNSDSEVSSSMDANSSTLSSMLHLMAKEDRSEGLSTDQEISQEPVSLQLVQRSFGKGSKINTQQIVVVDDSRKVGAVSVLPPVSPPLPKSPSESWLCRTLPLVSIKNSFLHSNQGTQFYAKRHDSNTTTSYTKWETIVKTSNLHHEHDHYSQELNTRKSQHSKS